MNTSDPKRDVQRQHGVVAAVLSSIIVFAATDGHTAGKHDIDPPASSEFGLGPRASIGGNYTATLRGRQHHGYQACRCVLGDTIACFCLRRVPSRREVDGCADRGVGHDVPEHVDSAVRPNEPRGR